MNGQKLKGMLGLALRARQAALGMDACRILSRAGKCGVLLLDAGAGPNTRKKAEDLCRLTDTPMVLLPPGLIEQSTGRSSMVIAVREGSFAEQFLRMNESQPHS